ncbi:MAG: NAD(P)H-dependent oxidoreductase [Cardiobacteriaceae bacterium]|nr:NAD(P)H-dependent oxidoreductase [Cardiobacteriaceae bacterium]
MSLLVINAHPDPHNPQSATFQMLAHLRSKLPASARELALYDTDIPALDADLLAVMYKRLQGSALNAKDQAIAARSAALLEPFMAATHLIIALPMHNFGIPSRLKDYLDNLIIPGTTFVHDDNGAPHGLLTRHKAWILQASGGSYREGSPIAAMEHTIPFLRTALGFIGIRDLRVTRADNTTEGEAAFARAVADACADIDRQWQDFLGHASEAGHGH